jgi:hypothetical protein
MRDACERIAKHRANSDRLEVLSDPKTRDAILWNLLILGEAAKRVPGEIAASRLAYRRCSAPTRGRATTVADCEGRGMTSRPEEESLPSRDDIGRRGSRSRKYERAVSDAVDRTRPRGRVALVGSNRSSVPQRGSARGYDRQSGEGWLSALGGTGRRALAARADRVAAGPFVARVGDRIR